MIINNREFRQFRSTHYYVDANGSVYSTHLQLFIKPRKKCRSKRSNTDYYSIAIYEGKVRHDIGLHIMVAECWIPNPNNKPTVNHKDGDGLNCKDTNLEWATRSEQTLHTFDMKLNTRRYGVIQMSMDGNRITEYTSALDAERHTGVSNSSINSVCKGKRMSAGGYRWAFT